MPHFEAREILDPVTGEPTGKYRMAVINDEGDVRGLCSHSHDSTEEALLCEDAWAQMRLEE